RVPSGPHPLPPVPGRPHRDAGLLGDGPQRAPAVAAGARTGARWWAVRAGTPRCATRVGTAPSPTASGGPARALPPTCANGVLRTVLALRGSPDCSRRPCPARGRGPGWARGRRPHRAGPAPAPDDGGL